MLAIDTNVVVRLLVRDDPQQTAAAATLFESETIFIPVSVILETEWVLRSFYKLDRGTIVASLRSVAGLRNVTIQSRSQVVRALDWLARGSDFADALHLCSAGSAVAFVTFDRALIKRAGELNSIPVRLP
jgi:predicted nucleic-acid-binding protein